MRFGVPDAKLEKWMIDRRVALLEEEGVEFRCDVDVGVDVTVEQLREQFDAVVLAIGSRVAARPRRARPRARRRPLRDGVPLRAQPLGRARRGPRGRTGRRRRRRSSAAGKRVVVIGGGDTGMDCVSNAGREGAADVILLDVYPELPAGGRYPDTPWPLSPRRLVTHLRARGGRRAPLGPQVTRMDRRGRARHRGSRREVDRHLAHRSEPIPGSEFACAADLVLIAIGFTHPEHEGLLEQLGVDLDRRGNVKAGTYVTSVDGVFAAGDARIGAVADRLGDRRGPPLRPRGRRPPDRRPAAAAAGRRDRRRAGRKDPAAGALALKRSHGRIRPLCDAAHTY